MKTSIVNRHLYQIYLFPLFNLSTFTKLCTYIILDLVVLFRMNEKYVIKKNTRYKPTPSIAVATRQLDMMQTNLKQNKNQVKFKVAFLSDILTLTRASNSITPSPSREITDVARNTTALLQRTPWLHLEKR